MSLSGRGLLKNSATTLVTMVLVTFVSLASKVVMSRYLGPDGMGAYALVILVPSLAFVFGNLGINTSNIYFVGNRKFEIHRIAGTVLTSAAGLGVISAGIIYIWALLSYQTIFRDLNSVYAVAAIVAVPFFFIVGNFMSILQGRNHIAQYNAVNLVSVVLSLALLSVFVIVLKMGLMGAVLAWLVTTLFNAGFAVFMVSRFTAIPLRFAREVFEAQINYGVRAYFANLAGFLVRRVDVLLVANIAGTRQLGYYSLAYTIGEMMWYLATSASTALMPYVAAADKSDSRSATAAVVRCTLWMTAALCIFVPFVDRFAIGSVFGEKFMPSVAPLRWLLPGILAGAVEKTLAADLIGRGRPGVTMTSAIIALVVNVPVNLVLIPKMGIAGAAIASSVAYSVAAVFTLAWFMRLTGCKLGEMLVLRASDVRYLGRMVQAGVRRILPSGRGEGG